MHNKGQLSIETMIIYGLVILVALSVVGALIYFNVLDLGSYLPDTCNLGGAGDVKCEEFRFTSDDGTGTGLMQLGVRNVGQKPIESLAITVEDEDGIHFPNPVSGNGVTDPNDATSLISNTNTLAPGSIAFVEIDVGTGAQAGRLLRGKLTTSYRFSGGVVTQESAGDLRIKAT